MHDWHIASDRRMYNGAPSSDLRRELDSVALLRSRAAKLGARAVYYPMEGQWSVWRDLKLVSRFRSYEGDALAEFLNDVGYG